MGRGRAGRENVAERSVACYYAFPDCEKRLTVSFLLCPEDTYIDGVPHFPGESDPLRLQLGIWDGSGAEGTSSWAGGPVNWDTAPQNIIAIVRSVSVEC